MMAKGGALKPFIKRGRSCPAIGSPALPEGGRVRSTLPAAPDRASISSDPQLEGTVCPRNPKGGLRRRSPYRWAVGIETFIVYYRQKLLTFPVAQKRLQ